MTTIKSRQIADSRILVLFALLLVSLIAYSPGLSSEFVLDAYPLIVDNPVIKQQGLSPKIFTKGFFDAFKDYSQLSLNYYRPLTTLSFALEYKCWGLNPFGYRLTNILLHTLNAFFVYLLVFRIFKKKRLSSYASILFCVLPVQEWVVNYVVGRSDLLETLFSLLSVLIFIYFLQTHHNRHRTLSLAYFACALLSRETALLLPLFIVLTAFYHLRNFRKTLTASLPHILMAVLYYALRYYFYPIARAGTQDIFSLNAMMPWISLSLEYAFRYLVPWSVFQGNILGTVLLSVGIILYLYKTSLRSIQNPAVFGLAWVGSGHVLFLVTGNSLNLIGPYLFEHYLYFSSIGFVLVLSAFILRFNIKHQRWIGCSVLLYYACILCFNNAHWITEKHLLERVQRKEGSDQYISSRTLAMKYGNDEGVIGELIEKTPNPFARSPLLRKLGNIYSHQGWHDKAVQAFQQAIRLNPRNINAYADLGFTYIKMNQPDIAIEWLKESLLMDEDAAITHKILGTAYYHKNDFKEAVKHLERAFSLNKDDVMTSLLLGMAYLFNQDEDSYQKTMRHLFRKGFDQKFILQFIETELNRHGVEKKTGNPGKGLINPRRGVL